MTSPASRLLSAGRAALVAATLAATAFAAAPVQAQQPPSFNFNLQLPGSPGGSMEFGFGQGGPQTQQHGGWQGGGRPNWPGFRCLTDREVRQGIARYGFSRVDIRRHLDRNRVEVTAVYYGWLYSMRVDKCTGVVDRVQPIRRVFGGGGGFGWHFQFGN